MKRLIALLLTVILVVSALPLYSQALTHEEFSTVLTPYSNRGFSQSATAKMNEEIAKIGAYPYYHYAVSAGSYENNDLVFTFKPLDVAFSDYPYIKVCYRTNSSAGSLDVSMSTPNGEKWMNAKPGLVANGEWNSLIFNYNDITGSSAAFPSAGEKNITMRLKPFGSGNFTVGADSYFDIWYVALFKTQAEAEAFNHNSTKISTYNYDILTADALCNKFLGTSNTSSVFYNRLSANESFVRATAAPGTYSNNLVLSFTHDAFPILEKPYIKICYRTDSTSLVCDVSMTSDGGENWLTSMPRQDMSETWSTLVFSVNDMTGNSNATAPSQDSPISVRLKPWGAGNFSLSRESYYDIKYIGFFATQSEADSFIYPGDSNYPFDFSLFRGTLNYNFASNKTVLDYIDESDARRDEILNTNNTVPYENHLTLSGVSGEYVGTYKDSSYKLTATAGTYGSGNGKISFTQNDVNFSEFPFVKIGYTTNSTYSLQAAYKNTSGNEAPLSVNDGVINLSGKSNMKSLEIMPFGTGARTLSSDMYCSIAYIGIFKTEAEARAYTYKGENADNMVGNYIIYTANLLNPDSTASGEKIFVSSSMGNDSNSGTSPDAPIKTIEELNKRTCYNCVVYFKRGDTFRTTSYLSTQHDTVYTSYGYGPKPTIKASIDGTGADKWSATSVPNVWKFNQTIANNTQQGDIGNICINGGELWGIKVLVHNNSDLRVDNGYVYNGRKYIEANADTLVNGGLGLTADLEFHHNYNGELYLYCEDGNPGEVFDSIEFADKGSIVRGTANNTVVDNLHITGGGSHGFGYGSVNNTAVTNCHLDWIGGSIQAKYFGGSSATVPTRYGNAVEAYGSAVNFTIANCFASQIYDCCWTVQNQEAVDFINVEMYDNVSEYANSGLEIWQDGGVIDHLYLHDNYTRYGGYGWSHQRPLKDGNFFYGGAVVHTTEFTNCSVENNVNILASAYGILSAEIGSTRYNFNNNTYIMAENKYFTVAPLDSEHGISPTHILYNYESLNNIVSRGTEKNSVFYHVRNDAFNLGENPREAFALTETPVTGVTLDTDVITLVVGDKYNVNASVYPSNATNKALSYSTTSPFVASVNESGVITANSPGHCKLNVYSNETGVSTSAQIYVINNVVPSMWSKKAAAEDTVTYNAMFVGDEFFAGENSFADILSRDFYLNTTKRIADGMSVAGANSVASSIDESADLCDMIFVSAGLNDYVSNTSLSDFESAFDDMITAIRIAAPFTSVIYVSPYFLNTSANELGLTLDDYIDSARAVCARENVTFADMSALSNTRFVLESKDGIPGEINGNLLDESYHMTAKGVEYFANDVVNYLTEKGLLNVYGLDAIANRYSAYKIYKNLKLSPSDNKFALAGLVSDGIEFFAKINVTGTEASTDNTYFQIDFSNANIELKKTPFIKIWYRTNVASTGVQLDLNAGVICDGDARRIWGGLLSYDKSGELASMTIDASAYFTGGDGISSFATIDDGSTLKYLRFKPYKSGDGTYTAGDSFELKSVSFYQTAEEAARDGMPEDGGVETTVTYGDTNSDGKVNLLDAIQMSRHIAAWNGYRGKIDFIASDIDRDGYVSPSDCVRLMRHLAKWGGYESIVAK